MTTQPHDNEPVTKTAALSRRLFVTASAAVGGLALAPASARAAIVRTDFSSLPPYGNGTLPPGVRSRAISDVNGLTVHALEAGFETPGRPAVLLLHGFPELAYSWRKVMPVLAAAGYHVIAPDQRGYGRTAGLGRFLRRRSRPVPHPQHGARRHRARLCARLPFGRRHCRARRRRAGRLMGCPDQARHLPVGGDHELAVRRSAGSAVQHCQRRPGAAPRAHRRRNRRRAGEAQSAAQVLPELSAQARGQRRHAVCPAGPAQFLPRLLPLQERRLEREQAVPAQGPHRRGTGEDPDLLRDGARQGDGGDGGLGDAVRGRDRGLQVADRGRGRGLRHRIRPHRIQRRAPGLPGAARLRSQEHRRDADVLRPHHRRAVDASSPARATGASTRPRASSTPCAPRRARGC